MIIMESEKEGWQRTGDGGRGTGNEARAIQTIEKQIFSALFFGHNAFGFVAG